jgi:hypothetical protein
VSWKAQPYIPGHSSHSSNEGSYGRTNTNVQVIKEKWRFNKCKVQASLYLPKSVILWGSFLTHTQGLHNDNVFQMPHMPISTFKNFSVSVLKVLNTFKWTDVSL